MCISVLFGSEQLHMERRVSMRSQLLTAGKLWSWIQDTAKPMPEKGKIPCLRHSRKNTKGKEREMLDSIGGMGESTR